MNETIKSKIKTRMKLYKQYIENGRFESDLMMIETLITEINDLITSTKDLHYNNLAKRLSNPIYKAALEITGAIQGTSREKIYLELGLESLKNSRWYKRLCCMFKIMNEEAPKYLTNLIPKGQQTIVTRNSNIPTFYCRTD